MSQLRLASTILTMVLAFACSLSAQVNKLSPAGCPLFHCSPEAQGVIPQPLIAKPLTTKANASLGQMRAQGCSGDGKILACLFATDTAAPEFAGTLKALDAKTLQPIWSSGVHSTVNLDGKSAALGQVPVIFADGSISAGDSRSQVKYDSKGIVIDQASLEGTGKNFGLTPLPNQDFGVVSQSDGVLTVVQLSSWQKVATLYLKDPQTGGALTLMSPSAAHLNTLYAVAFNASNSNGYLFAIDVTNGIPSVRTSFTFIGRSGASPVVVKPTQSGLTSPLVLLHSPEATTTSQAKHRLLGLLDNGIQILPAWSLSLNQSMSVAPAFDQTSRSIYVQADNGPTLLRVDINTGRVLNTYNIKSIGAFPLGFKLNGHLVATRSSTGFTLLLSGSVGQGTQIGQHVMAFAPLVNAKKLLWRQKIFASPEEYTGAWNLAPASSQSTLFCPVVMGPLSGLTLLCD